MPEKNEKILIIVSTGRCGTVRLSQILKNRADNDFSVLHQIRISRIANILGNILYLTGLKGEFLKKKIYKKILSGADTKYLINTDPLTAMMIPDDMIRSENVCILHLYRNSEDFAKSFYKFSRLKKKSFLAHNFIPFWQINLFPLQNWLLGKKVTKKYKKTAELKNEWFVKKYQSNKHFESADMKTVFNSYFIVQKINSFFGIKLKLSDRDLKIKANASE